jgi:hypothetical protein
MAIFWFICLPRILRAVLHPPAGGVKIICENGLKRVQLPWFNSSVVAGVSGVISLACCSTFLRSRPVSPLSASAGLFCSIAVAFMVYFYLWWRIRSGRHNLDINKDLGVVTLPGGRRIIKISEISAVTSEVNVTRNDRGQLNFCFVPSLRLRLPHSKSIALVSWTERSRSESFVGWLSTELGIP